MPLSDFSVQVGNALVAAFPQFEDFVRVDPAKFHLEIRFPHPKADLVLLISTSSEEITIFCGSSHRHIGMCQQWPIEKQIEVAIQFIGGILSGAVAFAQSSKYPGLWIDEDRSRAEHLDPDETVTFTNWNELAA